MPEQMAKTADSWIAEDSLVAFLKKRRGLLEGVVISGGEPTLQPRLKPFIRAIRRLGFRIKLDTNGSRPEVLLSLLEEELLDYVAMDVKTSLDRYPELVGPCVSPEAIVESARLIRDRACDYEFRATLIPEIHGMQEWTGMRAIIGNANRLALQSFRPSVTLDPQFVNYSKPSREYMERAASVFRGNVNELILR